MNQKNYRSKVGRYHHRLNRNHNFIRVSTQNNKIEQFIGITMAVSSLIAAIANLGNIVKELNSKTKHKRNLELLDMRHKYKKKEEDLKHKYRMEEREMKLGNQFDSSFPKVQDEGKRWKPSLIPISDSLSESILEKEPKPLDEMIKGKVIQPQYFVDTPIIPEDIALLVSPTGVGKSMLLVQILFNIARGAGSKLLTPSIEYAKYNKTPIAILYDSEMTENDMRLRYGNYEPPFLPVLQRHDFYDYKELLTHIEEQVCNYKTDIVIAIDNMTNVTSRELSSNQVTDFYRGLRMIQDFGKNNGFTVTFILVRHATKNSKGTSTSEISGSDWWGRLSTKIININFTKDNSEVRLLHIEKNRTGISKKDMYVSICSEPYLHFECNDELNVATFGNTSPFELGNSYQGLDFCKSRPCVEGVMKLHNIGKSYQEIADTYGVSKMTIKRIVDNNL